MKLMDLRAAMRNSKGNPLVIIDIGNGVPMTLIVQKTPLLEELGRVFNSERTAETGLTYDPETCVVGVDGFVGVSEKTCELNDAIYGEDLEEEDPAYVAEADGGDPIDDEDDDLL